MKGHAEFPELDKAIGDHARTIVAGDLASAEAFLSDDARESHRQFASKIANGSIKGFIALGRSRIGFQHISKVRFLTEREPLLILNRWREENGAWRIASTEDLSGKRSPWSDIETPAALKRDNHHA
ncbi:MAG TPA: hypothetical protein VN867_14935 [Candidatus Binataceae bacterium]|nr:hypothetical protein [Candidatus Binataceae bacterium]